MNINLSLTQIRILTNPKKFMAGFFTLLKTGFTTDHYYISMNEALKLFYVINARINIRLLRKTRQYVVYAGRTTA